MHHLHDTKRVTAAVGSTLLLENFICVYGWSCWRAGYETLVRGSIQPAGSAPSCTHMPQSCRRPLTLKHIGLGDDVITTTEATIAYIVFSEELPFFFFLLIYTAHPVTVGSK